MTVNNDRPPPPTWPNRLPPQICGKAGAFLLLKLCRVAWVGWGLRLVGGEVRGRVGSTSRAKHL